MKRLKKVVFPQGPELSVYDVRSGTLRRRSGQALKAMPFQSAFVKQLQMFNPEGA
jgi:hypothetical protein